MSRAAPYKPEWIKELRVVSNADLSHLKDLTELKVLILKGSRITDAGVKHLTALKGLKELVLQDTKVTAAGLLTLGKELPDCRVFRTGR